MSIRALSFYPGYGYLLIVAIFTFEDLGNNIIGLIPFSFFFYESPLSLCRQ